MTKDFTILAFDNEGCIVVSLHLCQCLRMSRSPVEVVLTALLPVVTQLVVLPVDFGEHGGIDRLQGHVLGLTLLLLQPGHGRLQGVRCHLSLQLGA